MLSALQMREDAKKEPKGGRWDRKNYKIILSYNGSAFSGWQKQPGLYTVQGVLEKALGRFSCGNRVDFLNVEESHAEATVAVAGRTDKGVHAAGQVCSFYTWKSDLNTEDIKSLINSLEPKALRAVCVEEVSRSFHPMFSAQWRRYVYLLPIYKAEETRSHLFEQTEQHFVTCEAFDVMMVNEMLSLLEGQQLSFAAFARDTKASRSRGPPTECFIYHARAAVAELPSMEQDSNKRREVMCVELVASRFLRKMVRVLVATSVREAVAGAPRNALVRLTEVTSRRASAPAAPACGLCLAEVSYENFSASSLLIQYRK